MPTSTRLAVIAHGQDRWLRAELHLATSTSSSSPSRPTGCPRRSRPPVAHRPRDPADADLLDVDAGRVACGRSTRRCAPRARTARSCAPSPATAPTTSAGPRPGSSRRCSRLVPSRGTRLSDRRYCDAVQPMVWQAVEPRQLRRRRAGDATPGRAAHPAGRGRPPAQARPRRACATSSSRVQLLQLVHGRADETLRTGTTLDGAGRARPPGATSDATTPRRSTRPTGSCAPSSTASSCTGCAART